MGVDPSLRAEAKSVVQSYFREVRPKFEQLQLERISIQYPDREAQHLLELSSRAGGKSGYMDALRGLEDSRSSVEAAVEIKAAAGAGPSVALTTATEAAILDTLRRILPTSAFSYQQVLQDLSDSSRASFRGTAAELREVLRDLLDHLAPDEEVLKTVRLEKGLSRPSMKQKTMFILKARGVGETSRRPAENAAAAVDESVGSLARSVYDRGSLSTHVATTRREVLTFKGYADAVLADLLEIHKQAGVSKPVPGGGPHLSDS
jgi:hypothetical protein